MPDEEELLDELDEEDELLDDELLDELLEELLEEEPPELEEDAPPQPERVIVIRIPALIASSEYCFAAKRFITFPQ